MPCISSLVYLLWVLLDNVWLKEKEIDKMGQNNVKSQTVVPTATCLRHTISDQAVALDGQTVFWADGSQDYSCSRRGGLWSAVYNINAWCSHTVRVDGQCLPDVELLIWSCQPSSYHQIIILLLLLTFTLTSLVLFWALFVAFWWQFILQCTVVVWSFLRMLKLRKLAVHKLYLSGWGVVLGVKVC